MYEHVSKKKKKKKKKKKAIILKFEKKLLGIENVLYRWPDSGGKKSSEIAENVPNLDSMTIFKMEKVKQYSFLE